MIKDSKKFIISVLLMVLSGGFLTAQEFALMPDDPVLNEGFRTNMLNDGYFGYGAAREYDDLRSYGLTGEYFFNDTFNLKFLGSGITQRGAPAGENRNDDRWKTDTPEPSRFDRLELHCSWKFYRHPAPAGEFTLTGETGFVLDGEFGGILFQRGVHTIGKVERPLPAEYPEPSFLTYLGIRGGYATDTGYPLILSAGYRVNTLGQPRVDIQAGIWDSSRDSRLYAAVEYAATADLNNDVQHRFFTAYEEGLNIRIGFSGTHVLLFQNVNIMSREGIFDGSFRSCGGIGFTTAAPQDTPRRDGNLSVETAYLTIRGVQTLLYFQPDWFLPLWPVLTTRSGFWITTGNGNSNPELDGSSGDWRYQYWGTGVRVSLLPPLDRRLPDLFADIGLGLMVRNIYTIDEYRSVPEKQDWFLTAELKTGVELPLPLKIREGRNRYGVQIFYSLRPVLGPGGPALEDIPVHCLGFALTIKDQGFTVTRDRIFTKDPGL